MKTIGRVACLVFVVVLIAPHSLAQIPTKCEGPHPNNQSFGSKSPTDRILYSDHVITPAVPGSSIPVSKSYGGLSVKGKITYVEVLDQKSDGKNGCITIISGGVFMSFVQIFLQSMVGESMNYNIRIYGH